MSCVKKVKKLLQSEGTKPSVQFEETSDEAEAEEDCKMEVDSEADSRK